MCPPVDRAGHGNASLHLFSLEQRDKSDGHGCAAAGTGASCWLVRDALNGHGSAVRNRGSAFDGVVEGLRHRAEMRLAEANAGQDPLELSRIRLGLLVLTQQEEFKDAFVVRSDRGKHGEFDDVLRHHGE
jgi:hypothetical protein